MSDQLLRLTGLWEKQANGSGRRYFVGRLGGARVVIVENTKRESDNDPSHYLCLGEAAEKPRQQQQPGTGSGQRSGSGGGDRQRPAAQRSGGARQTGGTADLYKRHPGDDRSPPGDLYQIGED